MQAIFTPFLLLTLPVAIPVGFTLATIMLGVCIAKSFFVVLTPLLWPLYWFCAGAPVLCGESLCTCMRMQQRALCCMLGCSVHPWRGRTLWRCRLAA